MTIDDLIKENEAYIIATKKRDVDHFVIKQYLVMAEDFLVLLKDVKSGGVFPRTVYNTIVDSFEIESAFSSSLLKFFREHPNLLK
jgi:hypothetical protein